MTEMNNSSDGAHDDGVAPESPDPRSWEAPVLHTERLILRHFAAEDFDAYAEMCADPAVMRYLSGSGQTASRQEAWRQLAMFSGHWTLRGYGMWAVEERSSGQFAGRVGLHYPEGWPGRELGWALAVRFWGKGLATEAARACLAHAFDTLGWSHVISLIRPGNDRSIRLAEGLGGVLTHSRSLGGLTHMVYRIDAGT